jgi:xylan 1,4-beta-xylosidase
MKSLKQEICRILVIPFFIISVMACHRTQTSIDEKPGFATFEWFEYQGYDPVYETLEPGPNEYINPILAGFYPDPSIVAVKNDFYLVNSTFSFYPGIPIFHSTDLVDWNQIGYVLNRPSQLNLDSLPISYGVFAPDITYNKGTFYLLNTLIGGGGNFIVTATSPAGPWSDPVWLHEIDGIDPSLFFDEDSTSYIVNNGPPAYKPLYGGHRAIWIQQFNADSLKLFGPRKVIVDGGVDIRKKPIWIEGPHIFKKDGWYYLIAAEGGTAEDHSEVVFRSKRVFGPYKAGPNNPILTQRHLDPNRNHPVTCTGHADFVMTSEGEWWSVFLGCTPYNDDCYNTGRQTFLMPVKWDVEWPVITSGQETVPYINYRPSLPVGDTALIPMSGNFTARDDFNETTLSLVWNFIRTPRERWYELNNGNLLIKSRDASIDELVQPSFIGRRQQHSYCSATVELIYLAKNESEKAGLVVFQNEKHYYLLAITNIQGKQSVILEKGSMNGPVALKSQTTGQAINKSILLKIEARGKFYDFYYAIAPDDWKLLEKDVDGTYLSTKTAGGFVGAYFGMYAYSSLK